MRDSTCISAPNILSDDDSSAEKEAHIVIRWVFMLMSIFQSRFFITGRAMTWLVKFIGILLTFLGNYSPKIATIALQYSRKMRELNKNIEDDCQFMRKAVCIKCDSVYNFDECLDKVGSLVQPKICAYKLFNKQCSSLLMKEIVTCNGNRRLYPHKVFCCSNLAADLQKLILRPGFLDLCESTRNLSTVAEGVLRDVFDGTIWKQFTAIDGSPFLNDANNYGLLLNIDWLQPFEHTKYSVGVIYLAILNLPRSIRFKQENVILYGVIPGPCEPSLTINTYLDFLVSDLLKLWKGVKLRLPGSDTETTFRAALLGVACDLPAARKVSGFLSYSANLGCSRCYQKFSCGFGSRNYDNFDRDKWQLRTNKQHRENVKKIQQCTTKTQRSELESRYGCRYSVLLKLPYFCPIEMTLIDPMHNLFLGTAKHFARDIWIGKNILSGQDITTVESKLRNVIIPAGIGRIPVSINTGVFLTADQWKNWTLYFSIYCLKDILSNSELECWRHFVLSCRKFCKFSASLVDIAVADELLVRFCKRAAHLYGSGVITPNMHMHCHLAECIKEFGPSHSFWLFPFERYNGILEGQPTNNRSVELQLMHRFRKDIRHFELYHECKDMPYADHFRAALPQSLTDLSSLEFDDSTQPGPRFITGILTADEIQYIQKFYCHLYPHQASLINQKKVTITSVYRKYSSVKWKGKVIHSCLNKNVKNPYVYVKPPFPHQNSVFDSSRLAEIQYFLLHRVTFPELENPVSHLLACGNWPMVHPNRNYYGKPVEVFCRNLYESNSDNSFFLAASIECRTIICADKVLGERVLTAIPLVE